MCAAVVLPQHTTEDRRPGNSRAMPRTPPKMRKHSANLLQQLQQEQLKMEQLQNIEHQQFERTRRQPTFGICFDVDGVLARGTVPIPSTAKAFQRLVDERGQLRVPVTFVTNSLNRNIDRANQISGWLGIPVSPEQMIQAPGPLELFTKLHDKFCLIVGQGKINEIVKDLGFKHTCTIEDIADAYPLLDVADHDNRAKIAAHGYREKDFPKVEAIVLLGEPKRWESALQLLVDLLRTDGKPTCNPHSVPRRHLPVIACNFDLQFMDRACMPRFGHGAFLLCLEALYKKVSGHDLQYSSLIGKPGEITFRYAEHVLTREARKLGYSEPLKTLYMIGDTPEVDIVGGNLYQRYVQRLLARRENNNCKTIEDSTDIPSCPPTDETWKFIELHDPHLAESRNVPITAKLYPQTIQTVESLLVCTGVYKSGSAPEGDGDEKHYQGHRDFPNIAELYKPSRTVEDVDAAIEYILAKEALTEGVE